VLENLSAQHEKYRRRGRAVLAVLQLGPHWASPFDFFRVGKPEANPSAPENGILLWPNSIRPILPRRIGAGAITTGHEGSGTDVVEH
jgi:hypothetical protein